MLPEPWFTLKPVVVVPVMLLPLAKVMVALEFPMATAIPEPAPLLLMVVVPKLREPPV